MNGAESLIETLLAGGVNACFTNPGTSEMHLVAALDRQPRMRSVLALFEGVATAAADGYARMTGAPACTLLHLGPGLANGLANLHNAWRARSPLINIVGQHATSHLASDTPLTSDIEGIARPYSQWLRTSRSPGSLGQDAADAVLAACTPPGQIATLIVPADAAWGDGAKPGTLASMPVAPLPAASTVESVAQKLRSIRPAALVLSGNALVGSGLDTAGRVAAATGASLFAPYPFPRCRRGAGTPPFERIPYVPEQAADRLKSFRLLILVGAQVPMAYFASPSRSTSVVPKDCDVAILSQPQEDACGALDALASALDAHSVEPLREPPQQPVTPSGALTLDGLAATISSLVPEGCIVVDESMTSGRGILHAARGAAPHDFLANTGGSIGIALPLAVGAATACPDRRVLCLTADGSGMYTMQALWSIAREGFHVTFVVFANRSYGILKREFASLGIGEPGRIASSLFSIGQPDLDWVSLAKGMGVPGKRVDSLDAFGKALRDGLTGAGPSLIEIPL